MGFNAQYPTWKLRVWLPSASGPPRTCRVEGSCLPPAPKLPSEAALSSGPCKGLRGVSSHVPSSLSCWEMTLGALSHDRTP